MKKIIPFFKPNFGQEDLAAIKTVLDDGLLTYGPKVEAFENEFKKLLNIPYAIALNSATSGLHLALIALGIKKGDKVIVPVNTYAATALAVEYVEAEIIFCDIDPETLCIDFESAREILKSHKDIKAMIPVHLGGRSVDIEALRHLKDEFNLFIIEDAAHAFYTKFKDRYIGSFFDITVFSFHPNKSLGTSEGGMICCNDKILMEKIKLLKATGINRNFNESSFTTSPTWLYDVEEKGYKYAMNSLSAALALSQMKKANDDFLAREKIALKYCGELKNISEIKLLNHFFHKREHSFHLFIVKAQRRNELYEYLRKKGIETSVHYRPLHLHSHWKNKGSYPASEKYYDEALSLPIYPSLSVDDQDFIIKAIQDFYLDFGKAQ